MLYTIAMETIKRPLWTTVLEFPENTLENQNTCEPQCVSRVMDLVSEVTSS